MQASLIAFDFGEGSKNVPPSPFGGQPPSTILVPLAQVAPFELRSEHAVPASTQHKPTHTSATCDTARPPAISRLIQPSSDAPGSAMMTTAVKTRLLPAAQGLTFVRIGALIELDLLGANTS